VHYWAASDSLIGGFTTEKMYWHEITSRHVVWPFVWYEEPIVIEPEKNNARNGTETLLRPVTVRPNFIRKEAAYRVTTDAKHLPKKKGRDSVHAFPATCWVSGFPGRNEITAYHRKMWR